MEPDAEETHPFPEAATPSFFFKGQLAHLLSLVVLLPVASALAAPALGDGALLGMKDSAWFSLCLGVAVLHQVYVWFGWRIQLGWGVFTRAFGDMDLTVWKGLFIPMLLARPVLVLMVGAADVGSLAMPGGLSFALAALCLAPAIYGAFSVQIYFGVERATGADHFRSEYRELPLVTEGAFSWTHNAMYTLVFLGLWGFALLLSSHAALVAALFQHAYIWVHYLATEQPDMQLIYEGGGPKAPEEPTEPAEERWPPPLY